MYAKHFLALILSFASTLASAQSWFLARDLDPKSASVIGPVVSGGRTDLFMVMLHAIPEDQCQRATVMLLSPNNGATQPGSRKVTENFGQLDLRIDRQPLVPLVANLVVNAKTIALGSKIMDQEVSAELLQALSGGDTLRIRLRWPGNEHFSRVTLNGSAKAIRGMIDQCQSKLMRAKALDDRSYFSDEPASLIRGRPASQIDF